MQRWVVALGMMILIPADLPARELVQDGKCSYVIVVPEAAIPSEKRAAEELQATIKAMTGAQLPIQSDAGPVPDYGIFLGMTDANQHVAVLDKSTSAGALGEEGFVIKPVGNHLILGGGRPRGTLYAVSSFLEDDLGCRWYSAGVSRIPSRKTIAMPAQSRVEVPAFEYREPFYTEAWDKDWAARNRCNGGWARLDKETGGEIAYHPWAHSFEELVPPKEYFAQHPEYFSEIDGTRRADRTQLCLTNPDVARIALEKVNKWIRKNPDIRMISVSQNDWLGPCTCAGCRKITESEGSHSGELLHFVNMIADNVAKRHPNVMIDTLAYQYTEKPPAHVKPHANVRVRLAPIANCFAHPVDTCPENKAAYENLKAWSRITNNLYIWHYNTNFSHYLLPFPDFDELQGSTRAYKSLGVKGIFFQGAFSKGGGGELAEMRSWVLSKMLWNPDRDIWKLMEDFANGYYEEAGPSIMAYLRMMHQAVRDENIHFRIYDDPKKVGYLRPDLVAKAEGYFRAAADAVRSKPEVADRVGKAQLALEYVRLAQSESRKERRKYADPVRDKVIRYGYTEVRENQPLSDFLKNLDEKTARKEK